MAARELQKLLDKLYTRENMHYLLEEYKESFTAPAIAYVEAWKATEIDFNARPDLIDVASAIHQLDASEILWRYLAHLLLNGPLTLQGAMGMLWHKVSKYVEMPYRRGHVLNVYVEALLKTGIVILEKRGKYNHLVATISVGDRGQNNYSYRLPSVCKHRVKSNRNAAYGDMHVMTGGKLKQHDLEVCLDHIQRLNDIPYKVETRITDMVQPTFEDTPKFKEYLGRYENEEEIAIRRKEFERFKHELPTRIDIMTSNGNRFFYGHRYDCRLRTYVKAYHLDFIGNKHARAFIQPCRGQMVQGMEEYL